MKQELRTVKTGQPCPDCGSSDALAINEDGSTKCFSCDKFTPSREATETREEERPMSEKVKGLYYQGAPVAIDERGIKQETASFYKVLTDNKGRIVYPLYDNKGNVIATKIRKSAMEKEFAITGNFREATLFGQHQFGTGGQYITLVEGQDDAMSAYQMLGSKWPVVSVHSASSAARDVANNLDFLESYENVVICFDTDDVGKKAAQAVAEKLSPNKAKIVHLPSYKDASDYLQANKAEEFRRAWWEHKAFSPAGVVSFSDSFAAYEETVSTKLFPLPKSFGKLESMLHGGFAAGEITTIGALTSVGKTTVIMNLIYSLLDETPARVGLLALETTVGEIVKSMIGLNADGKEITSPRAEFDSIEWKDRLYILDHVGSLDLDQMLTRIRAMIVAHDLDVFIIDPLHQALPDLNNDTVKDLMDRLLKLANQTGVALVTIAHMRKPQTDDAHDVNEYDLLGSSTINQVSFNTILLSRDKMHPDENVKSSIKLQMVKCRRTGETGEAGWLKYDPTTKKLHAAEDPYDLLEGFDEGL